MKRLVLALSLVSALVALNFLLNLDLVDKEKVYMSCLALAHDSQQTSQVDNLKESPCLYNCNEESKNRVNNNRTKHRVNHISFIIQRIVKNGRLSLIHNIFLNLRTEFRDSETHYSSRYIHSICTLRI